MAKSPAARFPSAHAIVAALEACLPGGASASASASAADPAEILGPLGSLGGARAGDLSTTWGGDTVSASAAGSATLKARARAAGRPAPRTAVPVPALVAAVAAVLVGGGIWIALGRGGPRGAGTPIASGSAASGSAGTADGGPTDRAAGDDPRKDPAERDTPPAGQPDDSPKPPPPTEAKAGTPGMPAGAGPAGVSEANRLAAESAFRRGHDAFRRREFASAVRDLDEALRLDPSHLLARIRRAEAHEATGRYAEAVADVRELLALVTPADGPAPYSLRCVLGRILIAWGRFPEAVTELDESLRLKPDYGDAWVFRGKAHYNLRDYTAAGEDMRQALRCNPGYPYARYILADVLLRARRFAEALAEIERVVAAGAQVPEYLSMRAEILRRLGRRAEAVRAARDAERLDPRDSLALFVRGAAAAEEGDHRAAVELFDQSIASAPNRVKAYLKRAESRRRLGDVNGALADCEAADRIVAVRSRSNLVRADIARDRKDLATALALADDAVRADAKFAPAYRKRAEVMEALGRNDEAKADRATAERLAPDSDDE
jgi:tetratricopeptide (TPR) repeat protein